MALFLDLLKAKARIKLRGFGIADLDCEKKTLAAALAALARGGGQQAPAKPPAPLGRIDVEVLDVEIKPAAPGGEPGKEQHHAHRPAGALGDHASDTRARARTVAR